MNPDMASTLTPNPSISSLLNPPQLHSNDSANTLGPLPKDRKSQSNPAYKVVVMLIVQENTPSLTVPKERTDRSLGL
jgi:hypothetical protein